MYGKSTYGYTYRKGKFLWKPHKTLKSFPLYRLSRYVRKIRIAFSGKNDVGKFDFIFILMTLINIIIFHIGIYNWRYSILTDNPDAYPYNLV